MTKDVVKEKGKTAKKEKENIKEGNEERPRQQPGPILTKQGLKSPIQNPKRIRTIGTDMITRLNKFSNTWVKWKEKPMSQVSDHQATSYLTTK